MYFICMDLFSMFVPPFCGGSMCTDTISAVYLYSKPPPLFDSPYRTMWSCMLCTGLVCGVFAGLLSAQLRVCIYACVSECSQIWQLMDFSPYSLLPVIWGKNTGEKVGLGTEIVTNDVLIEVKIRTQS